ncbi:MAG: hypothetical protein PHI67_07535 [Candidatus Methanomethylophilaceae archaeon]|nr:hypothetical protein [Candidatus Methanomethylophilaceae archaeon]
MEDIDALKEAAEFLPGVHPPFVGPVFEPDHTVSIEVRLILPLRNSEYDNNAISIHQNIFGLYGQRALHVLRSRVTDELIDPTHIPARQTGYGTIISHAKKERASIGVGKRCHLRSKGIGIGDIALELAAAVFASSEQGFEGVRDHRGASLWGIGLPIVSACGPIQTFVRCSDALGLLFKPAAFVPV